MCSHTYYMGMVTMVVMVVSVVVAVAPTPDQKGLQVYFHICNDCIQVIWENTKDERYSTMVSVVAWLLHHVGGVLASVAPTPWWW